MRAVFLTLALAYFSIAGAQTATNWKVNDCSGISRELFQDLDGGKVVVVIWVMPCALCIDESLISQTEVQNALSTNPGRVVFYMADDNGNTDCTTMADW